VIHVARISVRSYGRPGRSEACEGTGERTLADSCARALDLKSRDEAVASPQEAVVDTARVGCVANTVFELLRLSATSLEGP
jgi:hypothetical protein